ncbi:MAG: 4Fe-4S dicluster domain-containing protein [Candidatus Brocadiia bacterium]|nr:MAG: 4Fe-4S dicluster domain-containing protein [Candidatus Brocadiia bacterium]
MAEKLIIDLAKIDLQANSGARCSYVNHPENRGVDSLLEMVRFALICRRCESAPCVKACPSEALEKLPSKYNDAGVLKRWNMRCTGCGTCAIACPFGTIYTDLIPFPSSVCDLCSSRLANNGKPLCVNTCKDQSIEYRAVNGKDAEMIEVFDGIVVKVAGGSLWEPFLRKKQEV